MREKNAMSVSNVHFEVNLVYKQILFKSITYLIVCNSVEFCSTLARLYGIVFGMLLGNLMVLRWIMQFAQWMTLHLLYWLDLMMLHLACPLACHLAQPMLVRQDDALSISNGIALEGKLEEVLEGNLGGINAAAHDVMQRELHLAQLMVLRLLGYLVDQVVLQLVWHVAWLD